MYNQLYGSDGTTLPPILEDCLEVLETQGKCPLFRYLASALSHISSLPISSRLQVLPHLVYSDGPLPPQPSRSSNSPIRATIPFLSLPTQTLHTSPPPSSNSSSALSLVQSSQERSGQFQKNVQNHLLPRVNPSLSFEKRSYHS